MKRCILITLLMVLAMNANAGWLDLSENKGRCGLGVNMGFIGWNTRYGDFGWGPSINVNGIYLDFLKSGPAHEQSKVRQGEGHLFNDSTAVLANVGYQLPIFPWLRVMPLVGYCQTNAGVTDVSKTYYEQFAYAGGDCFEEFIVYHQKFLTWMRVNGYDTTRRYTQDELNALLAESPYHLASANDIDWVKKVQMQGRIQKWVDHSISVTINLPADTTEELVNELYIEAWRQGCKGCTVYRDGCRSGVLIAAEEKKDEKKRCEPCDCRQPVVEVRPKVLKCDVVRFQNNREKWVAFVGLLDGRPYEIFTGLQDDDEGILLPKSVTEGVIIKNIDENGVKHYDFQFTNKRGYKTTIEGLSEKFNKEFWNYAKLISGVLRYRMPIDQVIKMVGSLEMDNETINTWKVGVERALKKYIVDGTAVKDQACPSCGEQTLVYEEGCLHCTNCGYSRCG